MPLTIIATKQIITIIARRWDEHVDEVEGQSLEE
jgi:hypothetical protein